MKRILSYILSILLLVSCSNNDFGNVQNSIQKSPKEASYLRQIQQLNEQYIHHVQKSSRAQGDDDNDNDNDVNGWEVALEDTRGACAVGKAALFYTRNPYIIGVVMIFAGALVSYGEYEYQRDNDNNQILQKDGDFFAIDIRQPLNLSGLFDTDVFPNHTGGYIGKYHNKVIFEVETNDLFDSVAGNVTSDTFDAFVSILREEGVFLNEDIDEACSILQTLDVVNNLELYSHFPEAPYMEIEEELVSDFLINVSNIQECDRYAYILSYMDIIDGAAQRGELSSQSATLINGSLSVWYHSHCLWNYYIPMPRTSQYYLARERDRDEGSWTLLTEEGFFSALSQDNVNCFGVPHLVNNRLSEVYFYENASDYLQSSWNVSTCFNEDSVSIESISLNIPTNNITIDVDSIVYFLRDVADNPSIKYIKF